jgi:hypothetical protein
MNKFQLLDEDTQDVFEVAYDSGTWTVTTSNAARAQEAELYAMRLRSLRRHYGPSDGPFLRYCLWHLQGASQLTLVGGLPDEPEGSDPTRIY